MARILLVEDDLDVRALLEYVLGTEGGFEVTAVESVANATALLAAQPFDLVVTDVNLPDGNGLRIADQAKAKGVKALVLTAHGLSLAPGELAAYDYMLKPIRVKEFLEAVRRQLPREDGQVVSFPKA
ncbi:MAG TPA: response regulator [Stellaceae bacterium]|nr:response regulator [Stellaceae bacterium]